METRLTEFSYGYCVTQEFTTGVDKASIGAPFFPSLYDEGKPGGGFDVRIGSALFLQFKLTDELKRRSALEAKRGLLSPEFFRFWIHRRDLSKQHQMLIELEGVPGNQVFYIAPAFATVNELNKAYSSGTVVERSAIFSPADIGPLPDDEYHRVSFKPGDDFGWFLSEPKKIRVHRRSGVIEFATHRHSEREVRGLDDWLGGLELQMRTIIENNFGTKPNVRADSTDRLGRIAYLSRAYFGCEFFIFRRTKQA